MTLGTETPLARLNPEDDINAEPAALTHVGPPRGDGLMAYRSPAMVQLDEFMRFAIIFARSGLFKGTTAGEMQERAAKCAVKIIAGAEFGLSPMAAMRSIYVFDGNVTMSAPLILAQINKHPFFKARVCGGARCKPEAHPDHDQLAEGRVHFWTRESVEHDWEELPDGVFTIEQARDAGLLTKDNWKHWKAQMLRWRAVTDGARMNCPEVFNGAIYAPDEIEPDLGMNAATGEPTNAAADLMRTVEAAHANIAQFDDELLDLAKRANWSDEMLSAQAQRLQSRDRLREFLKKQVESVEKSARSKAQGAQPENGHAPQEPEQPETGKPETGTGKPETPGPAADEPITPATRNKLMGALSKRGIDPKNRAKRLEFVGDLGYVVESFSKLTEPQGKELLEALVVKVVDESTGEFDTLPRVLKARCAVCHQKKGEAHLPDCLIDETDEPEQKAGDQPVNIGDLFNGGGRG